MFRKVSERAVTCILIILLTIPLFGFTRLNPYVRRLAPLDDITGHWAEERIMYIYEHGWARVLPDGTIRPNEPMTQSEFERTMSIWTKGNTRLLEYLDFRPQPDYASADPEGFITRQDASVIWLDFLMTLHNSVIDEGFFANVDASLAVAKYTDADSICPHALYAVGTLTELGVLSGFADGYFRPKDNITRAEVYSALAYIDLLLFYGTDAPIGGLFQEPAHNPVFFRTSNITRTGFDIELTLNNAAITEGTVLQIAITADAGLIVTNDNFRTLNRLTIPISEMDIVNEFVIFTTYSAHVSHSVDGTAYVFAQLTDGDISGGVSRCIVIQAGPAVKAVAAADEYTLVLTENGDLFSFGNNNFGQLGIGTNLPQSTPAKVMGNISAVFTNNEGSSFAIDRYGNLWAWGRNDNGQLGTGDTSDKSSPVMIFCNVRTLITTPGQTYAITENGQLFALRYSPVFIMENVRNISAGFFGAVYAVTEDFRLYGWGSAEFGQLLGRQAGAFAQSPVHLLDNVMGVAASENAVYFISTGGTLYGFGMNNNGSLGAGQNRFISTPVRIMDNVCRVAVSGDHAFAITTTGKLYGFGSARFGNLGLGNLMNIYTPKRIMAAVEDIVLGINHTIVLDAGGTVWGFGRGYFGQMGNGTLASAHYPIRILNNAAAIFAAPEHSFAASRNGGLLAWGQNLNAQLGVGAGDFAPVPINVDLR